MSQQSDESGDVSAGQGQESLDGPERDWFDDYKRRVDPRQDDGDPNPPSERPEGPTTNTSTDPEPPVGA